MPGAEIIFEGGSRSQEEGSLTTKEQTGSKHDGLKLMGELWAWSCSFFLSAKQLDRLVTWQIFIVFWTGAEKKNKNLWTLFSISPRKASANLPTAGCLFPNCFLPHHVHDWTTTDQITFHLYSHPEKLSELWRASLRFLGLYQRHKCPLTPPNSSRVSQEAQTQDAAGQFQGLHCRINSDKL